MTRKLEDTTVFCQTSSPWISNCLLFYKKKKKNKWRFEKKIETDDGQRCDGKRIFKEYDNKVILYKFYFIEPMIT